MKLWIDDLRPAPEGYVWCHSVWRAEKEICIREMKNRSLREELRAGVHPEPAKEILALIDEIELIDIDHDLGDYAVYGGDGVKLLDWLEETGRNYSIRIHSMNPVGIENMRRIIERNGWKEIK